MMYKTCVVFIDYDRLKMTTPRDYDSRRMNESLEHVKSKP